MRTYEMIKDKELNNITKERLAAMYNDAVETIWLLEERIDDLYEENDAVWESYEEISNKFYGGSVKYFV